MVRFTPKARYCPLQSADPPETNPHSAPSTQLSTLFPDVSVIEEDEGVNQPFLWLTPEAQAQKP